MFRKINPRAAAIVATVAIATMILGLRLVAGGIRGVILHAFYAAAKTLLRFSCRRDSACTLLAASVVADRECAGCGLGRAEFADVGDARGRRPCADLSGYRHRRRGPHRVGLTGNPRAHLTDRAAKS